MVGGVRVFLPAEEMVFLEYLVLEVLEYLDIIFDYI